MLRGSRETGILKPTDRRSAIPGNLLRRLTKRTDADDRIPRIIVYVQHRSIIQINAHGSQLPPAEQSRLISGLLRSGCGNGHSAGHQRYTFGNPGNHAAFLVNRNPERSFAAFRCRLLQSCGQSSHLLRGVHVAGEINDAANAAARHKPANLLRHCCSFEAAHQHLANFVVQTHCSYRIIQTSCFRR
ncbi:hypothetical protein D3C81_1401390 [compost metagenome]